jgi:TnpA family transposase
VVRATAALLGRALASRIARMHELTLYKLDRSRHYPHLDPILDGTVKPHLVRRAWDDIVRESSPRSTPEPHHRRCSYACQHSVHQAVNEIGRVERTLHILCTIDDEEFRVSRAAS